MLKAKRSELVAMFKALGFEGADGWTPKRLGDKIAKLDELVDEDTKLGTDADMKLLKAVLKSGCKVEIVDDGDTEAGAEEKPAKTKKSTKDAKKPAKTKKSTKDAKKPEPEPETADDEEEEEEDDEEEEETVPVKPTKTKKAKGKKTAAEKPAKAPAKKDKTERAKTAKTSDRPGVISTIISTLQKATEKKPITKEGLLEVLVKSFPDREESAMLKTINTQVPNRIKKDKGLTVSKNEKGYWIGG